MSTKTLQVSPKGHKALLVKARSHETMAPKPFALRIPMGTRGRIWYLERVPSALRICMGKPRGGHGTCTLRIWVYQTSRCGSRPRCESALYANPKRANNYPLSRKLTHCGFGDTKPRGAAASCAAKPRFTRIRGGLATTLRHENQHTVDLSRGPNLQVVLRSAVI